jgi:hypothetical protein
MLPICYRWYDEDAIAAASSSLAQLSGEAGSAASEHPPHERHGACEKVFLCAPCHEGLIMRKNLSAITASFPIANGFDYGDLTRIPGLIAPNMVERMAISPLRPYANFIKLSVNAHRTLDHHIITMPQDAIDSVPTTLNRIRETTFPNMESLDCVSIAFVGTNNQFEAHRKETSLAVTKVMARTQVLFQMLKLLKATRPDRPFCDMKLNHNETSFELKRIEAVQFIINSVVKCDTADAINMDQRIGSDVANARGPTSGPSLDSLRTGSTPSSLSRALLRAMNGPQSPLFAIPEGVNENSVVGRVDQATAEEESASALEVPLHE